MTFQLPVLSGCHCHLHPLCCAVTPVSLVPPPVHTPSLSCSLHPLHPPVPLQKDLGYLQQWVKTFVGTFEKSISLSSLEPRR